MGFVDNDPGKETIIAQARNHVIKGKRVFLAPADRAGLLVMGCNGGPCLQEHIAIARARRLTVGVNVAQPQCTALLA